jgi:2-keto-4-pentenoate hydratase/2-oxohepta-3-ene-1,7-dioic acid hydratase in catechol pathway
MKLATFRYKDSHATLGVILGDQVVGLAGLSDVPESMIELIAAGPEALKRVAQAIPHGERVPLNSVCLLAPIPQPPEFLGVGLNYRDHALEAKMALPTVPLFFNKQTSCITGPLDDIVMPRVSDQLDYEGELGLVVGHAGRYLSREAACAAIFGYVVVNDVSVRDWQLRSPTHTMGKSFDTHGPFGPWIVTVDEIPLAQSLSLITRVNDEVRQRGSTADMIFDCVDIIVHLSQVMSLRPGTLIATGTPAGVAYGKAPPPWLRIGDEVSVSIEGIGKLVNRVIAEPASD